jgi:hypothetical protein
MDDPTRRCENDTDKWKRVTRGSCSQARAPLFCAASFRVGQPIWLSFRTSQRTSIDASFTVDVVGQPIMAARFKLHSSIEIEGESGEIYSR